MGGRCKRKEPKDRGDETSGETEVCLAEPQTPVPGVTLQRDAGCQKGKRCSMYDGDKVYLGVRVKMPVRDLLRKVRIAQGYKPQDLPEKYGKTVKEDKQRVKTRTRRRTGKRKLSTKSLEELAIIIEVLEEDLKTGNTCCSPPQSCSNPPVSPEWSPTGSGYNSDESEEMIPSPQAYMIYSPGTAEYQQTLFDFQPSSTGRAGWRWGEWDDPPNCDWSLDSSDFFWTQLQREESKLRDISDAVLLTADEHGSLALHKVACVGKRALGYAIAKRMAALNSLDLRDADGMTALLHAAKHNDHLMVADLIYLGADVNVTNNSGKTCLHLSAERGYIRVLEVLKHTMMDGVFVDVEATDNSGMSVLQCASVALKATVRKLESSKSSNYTRLHMLRQEQMMETLECLLQMGSLLHTMGSQSMLPRVG